MPDNDSFLQAIYERPDDTGLRLVYADWLEEHGNADRADFIRVQCELARTSQQSTRRRTLRERENSLLNEHQLKWAEPLLAAGAVYWHFRRGFPSCAVLSVRDLIRHGGQLLRHSTVRRLRLLKASGELGALADCHPLNAVRALDFYGSDVHDEDVAALADCRHLSGVTTLDLRGENITSVGVRALCRAFPRLRRLNLAGNSIGDDGLEALARSTFITHLRMLGLARCAVGDRGVTALAFPALPMLERLDLGLNSDIGLAGISTLATTSLPRLVDLRLAGTSAGDAGAEAMAASPLLTQLHRLDVGQSLRDKGAPVTAVGVRAIFGSAHLHRVRSLRLTAAYRRYRDPALQTCRRRPYADSFHFKVEGRDNLYASVRASVLPPRLERLRLIGFGPGEDQAHSVASWPALAHLSHLEVRDAKVSPLVATAFVQSDVRLRTLRLPAAELGKGEIHTLLTSPNVSRLKQLRLTLPSNHPRTAPMAAESLRAISAANAVQTGGVDVDALLGREDWPLPWRNWLAGPRLQSLLATHEVTTLGDAEVIYLASMPILERLIMLDLFCVRIGPEGARALAASPHLRNLRSS